MTQTEFIQNIAKYVQQYAPQYNIKVCSPIIAQAILESASGTSELAVKANNYFGLKYSANRCPSATGIYYKVGSEQNADGSYTSSAMQWMKFPNMQAGVKGYFDFINTSRYANLKNVTNPLVYLTNIKNDGYATSLKYVENLMSVISKYNLVKYDEIQTNPISSSQQITTQSNTVNKKMTINIHGGHNPEGKTACGAVGFLNESREDRIVKDKLIKLLRDQGHVVYDCTVDNGTSQSDVLHKIVDKCNGHPVDLDISIHFNAGASDKIGNGVTTGTEVFVYSPQSKAKNAAQNVVNEIAKLGFKNRGLKYSTSLYVLKNTKSPSMLIECCFVDDKDDAALYNADKMAAAIVKGITGKEVSTSTPVIKTDNNKEKFIKELQKICGLPQTGIADKTLLKLMPSMSKTKNDYHPIVRPLQQYLTDCGFSCGKIDGAFGPKTEAALKQYQTKNGCNVDGALSGGGTTWSKLLGLK